MSTKCSKCIAKCIIYWGLESGREDEKKHHISIFCSSSAVKKGEVPGVVLVIQLALCMMFHLKIKMFRSQKRRQGHGGDGVVSNLTLEHEVDYYVVMGINIFSLLQLNRDDHFTLLLYSFSPFIARLYVLLLLKSWSIKMLG